MYFLHFVVLGLHAIAACRKTNENSGITMDSTTPKWTICEILKIEMLF